MVGKFSMVEEFSFSNEEMIGEACAGARCDAETVELFTLARCCASVGWTMPRLAPGDPINRSHIARATGWAETVMGS